MASDFKAALTGAIANLEGENTVAPTLISSHVADANRRLIADAVVVNLPW